MVIQYFSQTDVLMDYKVVLWGGANDSDAKEIASGLHQFPFSFVLPMNLPPSHKADLGAVEYEISSEVHVPGILTSNIKTKIPIKVLVLFNNIKVEPEMFEAKKNIPFNKDKPIHLNAFFNSTTVVVGQVAQLTYDIFNESPKTLQSGKIELLCHHRYFAHGANIEKSSTVYTMNLKEDFPILSTSKRNRTLDMQIPSTIEPTLPKEISQLVHCYYEIKITLDISGLLSGHCELAVPILINPQIPAELFNVIPPIAFTGQPGISVLPQDDKKHYPQFFYWQPWYAGTYW